MIKLFYKCALGPVESTLAQGEYRLSFKVPSLDAPVAVRRVEAHPIHVIADHLEVHLVAHQRAEWHLHARLDLDRVGAQGVHDRAPGPGGYLIAREAPGRTRAQQAGALALERAGRLRRAEAGLAPGHQHGHGGRVAHVLHLDPGLATGALDDRQLQPEVHTGTGHLDLRPVATADDG